MEELAKFFPPNIKYAIPYNITPVIEAAIKKVLTTLGEAMILVFLVMFLFLQSVRYTFIPAVVVPVSLIGSCVALLAFGFSINLLTLFAMVLAIGILTDDAIVVVENVERIMSEEGLPPREAARKAMKQITGAIIGITLVLESVFIPMAFFPGSVGIIYRQFSVTMVAAIGISAFLSLSLNSGPLREVAKAGRGWPSPCEEGSFSDGSTANRIHESILQRAYRLDAAANWAVNAHLYCGCQLRSMGLWTAADGLPSH